jgi:hypothetical protein
MFWVYNFHYHTYIIMLRGKQIFKTYPVSGPTIQAALVIVALTVCCFMELGN